MHLQMSRPCPLTPGAFKFKTGATTLAVQILVVFTYKKQFQMPELSKANIVVRYHHDVADAIASNLMMIWNTHCPQIPKAVEHAINSAVLCN